MVRVSTAHLEFARKRLYAKDLVVVVAVVVVVDEYDGDVKKQCTKKTPRK